MEQNTYEGRITWLALIIATLIALACGGATWAAITGEEEPRRPPVWLPPGVNTTAVPAAPTQSPSGAQTAAPARPSSVGRAAGGSPSRAEHVPGGNLSRPFGVSCV